MNFPFPISSLPKRLLWMTLCYLSSSSSKWLTLLQYQFFLVKAYRESSTFKNILHQQTVATEPLCFKLVRVWLFDVQVMTFKKHSKDQWWTTVYPWVYNNEQWTKDTEQWTRNCGERTVAGGETWNILGLYPLIKAMSCQKKCNKKTFQKSGAKKARGHLLRNKTFLGTGPPLLAYRTEWCIWAAEERIAGMIGFVAMNLSGALVSLAYLLPGVTLYAHACVISGNNVSKKSREYEDCIVLL